MTEKVGATIGVLAGWFFLLLVAMVALQSALPWVQDQYENWVEGDPYLKVWVNPEVKVYYGPGDKAYGNTLPGFYLSQARARSGGYRSTNSWGVGYGTSERPLRTMTDLAPLAQSKLSMEEGSVTLFLNNKSNWEITDVTVWVSVTAGPKQMFQPVGRANPNSEAIFSVSTDVSPNGKKWTWGFSKVKGFVP